jgi:hypothetical protein
MRQLFLALILTSLPTLAAGQVESSINGLVVTEADSLPRAGVRLTLESPNLREPIEIRSGPEGYFAFSRLVPGEYLLTTDDAGFAREQYRLTLRPREAQNLRLGLNLRPLEERGWIPYRCRSGPTCRMRLLRQRRE